MNHPSHCRNFILCVALLVTATTGFASHGAADEEKSEEKTAAQIQLNEWPSWRGPTNDGTSILTGLPDRWTAEDEVVLWKAPVGGRSTPVVHDGRVYVIRLTGDGPTWQEETVALDAHTGEILWRHGFDLFHTDIPSDRVGWSSPAVDPETGNVYVHGVQGHFYCYDRDGNVQWHYSLTEEFGRISGYGGRTHTPFIDGDLVILSFLNSSYGDQGRGMHRYVAMDKRTGEIVWWSTPGGAPLDTTFSVPAAATINGVRQLIAGNADGSIYGMKMATGEKIWGFKLSKRGINASVVVHGDKVYASHSEDNVDNTQMGRVVCIDATGTGDVTKTHEVWRYDGFTAGYASPVLADGRLYVANNSANMVALDAETGEELWKLNYGKFAWGSPVYADGKIYVAEIDSKFHVIEPGENGAEILSTRKFIPSDEFQLVDIRGCPAVAYGRIYLMTREALWCIGREDYAPLDEPPTVAMWEPEPGEPPATHVQVVPAETHVRPGTKVDFAARLFDAKGRLIGEGKKAQWRVKGLIGQLNDDTGSFRTSSKRNGQFGLVNAYHETDDGQRLTGTARLLVEPNLPIEEDFEGYEPGGLPAHWLGATSVKFEIVEEEDGNRILKKDATRPRFRRAEIFVGPPEMSGYTIEADMRGLQKGRNLPDMGLINSRYQFDLRGNVGELRILSWIPMPRVIKTIPMEMEPGVWYTMKCRVDYKDDGAVVRGKIWPRDQNEPEAWTIELEDPMPHRNGSPGIAVFSMAEVHTDNLKVYE